MGSWLIVVAVNLAVDAFIGLTEVAGFSLPIVYTGPLAVGMAEGLILSFAAFVVSGTLDSVNYNRTGDPDIPSGIRLSLGSLVGAILGVKLSLVVPGSMVKILLYVVVLLSGISILLREDRKAKNGKMGYTISEHLAATSVLDFVIGAICTLSGTSGPVLVMLLLVILGIGTRTAVGVFLFDSVLISIPACIGYMMQCNIESLLPVVAIALVFHAMGVVCSSRNVVGIDQVASKKETTVFSILIAVWKPSSQLL